ncbi:SDR family oxidoreductase [Streptomyces gilvus]|uniref:SDR family oxidoreductase n=1 Tax=Streptomyces gilvus TaxID=2920937 RepID=UPI001F0EFBEA|nr:SDR family oxidoreductase [Streptomyces sp. CME 23]MCH5671477.1 SDR family oxidoreductase [Streptomyces sp. CME 23]
MSLVITGATGNLGRAAVETLLEKVPADHIIAVVRSEGKAADLAARGVRIAVADYNSPKTFEGLFTEGDKVLLVSGSEMGKDRAAQHKVVIDAARAAGVALLAYTSVVGALTSSLADDHRATEGLIRESGLPYVVLRNAWYHENYTSQLAQVLEHGAVTQAAGEGRIATASRDDLAAAAAAVLVGEGHEGKTYELTGDTAYSFAEFAAELTRQTGKDVTYHAVQGETYLGILTGAGVPPFLAEVLVDFDTSIEKGELAVTTDHLSTLIGRPAAPITDAIAVALKS